MSRSLLITRIGELVTNAADGGGPGRFAAISDAALVISGDRVAWTGPAAKAPAAAGRRRLPRRGRAGGAAWVRGFARAPGIRGGAVRRVRGADGGPAVPGG